MPEGSGQRTLPPSSRAPEVEPLGLHLWRVRRAASRAGTVPGEVVLGGRKVAVQRPRVRADGREVPLPTFQGLAAVYETARARGATVVVPPARTANVSGHGPR